MQPLTIVENRPSRSGYSDGYNVGAASCTSVLLILYAIGAAVCGAAIYLPSSELFTPDFYQIIAFIESGLYLMTAIIGFASISRYTCTIVFFMIISILTTLASLGALGYYSFLIYDFAISGIFTDCQVFCMYTAIPICVLAFISFMGFISSLAGSIYCCQGMSSPSRRRPSSTLVVTPQSPPAYRY